MSGASRVVLWANLTAAARAWATSDNDETRAALSREAKAWAAQSPEPRKEAMGERSAVAGDGWTFRFGRNSGKRPEDVTTDDLRWYERVFLESLDEFTGTYFVGVPDVTTMPLLMFNASMGGNYQIASITALLLLVPSIAFMLLVERFLKADVLAMIGR